MRKRFVLTSDDLQAVLNENADRNCLPVGNFPELIMLENEPVVTMYDANHFVRVEDVPECAEDCEEALLQMIDEKNLAAEEENQILPFAGAEPRLRVPGRVVKICKRIIHPERKSAPVAACFCAATGLLVFVY